MTKINFIIFKKSIILPNFFSALHLSIIILVLASCVQPSLEDHPEANRLLKVRDSLETLQRLLKVELDSIWATTNTNLASMLPSTMPAQERKNMLALNNAPLIKMFEVYESLDTNIHRLVDNAAQADKRIAVRYQEIEAQKDAIQSSMETLLLDFSKTSKAAFDFWNKKYTRSFSEE
jgi:uncharacterized protein YdcH (DUF465 family)